MAEARWFEARGVDAVIAQGADAGGHRGMFLTDDVEAQPGLFTLLPQVADAVRGPIIAAGGIVDGRELVAAFALRARAVQIGAAHLKTPQANLSPVHRQALAAACDDTTRLTNLFTGRPARGLLNRFIRDHANERWGPAFPRAAGPVASLRAHYEARGSGDYSPLWAGQAAPLAREEDAFALTARLWLEASAALATLPPRP